MLIKTRVKTQKFCKGCGKLKPVAEFHWSKSNYDGLNSRCRKCRQTNRLATGGKRYMGLHKRPYPLDGRCEICNTELIRYCYHHWDDNNLNLGIWVCGSCDYFMEGIDEIDKNPFKVDIYHRLKNEAEVMEKAYVYLGPLSPPNNIHKLYSLNGQLTHRWCPHCGNMKQVNDFSKNRSKFDGFI